MKKFAALFIALIFALSCFAFAEEESYTIGIAQFAEHGSLDNCREGFLAGLAEEGIVEGENLTVEYHDDCFEFCGQWLRSDLRYCHADGRVRLQCR